MKLVLVIIMAIVLLVGGGGTAAWFMMPELIAPYAEMIGITPPGSGKSNRPAPKPPTGTMDLDPLTIPLIDNGEVTHFLVVEMSLEVVQGREAEVSNHMPRLKDAYLSYMMSLAQLDFGPGIGDLDFVKRRLMAVTREVTGSDAVRGILFKNAFERRIR